MNDSVTAAIKARLNLAEVAKRFMTLQRKGGRWVGLCPFHQEKSPSFSINEEEGLFYCFGCHASGDIFDFYGRLNGLDFKETLEQLAAEANVPLERGRPGAKGGNSEADARKSILKMYDLAKSHYKGNLAGKDGEICRAYVEARKIAPEILEAFDLGFSLPQWNDLGAALRRAGFSQEQGVQSGLLLKSERGGVYDRFRGRFMFPIKNQAGQTIAFGGRIIPGLAENPSGGAEGGKPAKYVNSADSPVYKKGDNIYGLFQARRSISSEKSVILTEGYMDVLTLHQFGYTNACGVLGTALTAEQVRRLSGFCSDFELIFDADLAGRKAALRSCEMILARGLRCRVVLLPDGEDIDSLLHGQGPKAFARLREAAPEGLDFCIRTLRASFAPKDSLEWVRSFLKSFEQPEIMPRFLTELCRGLDLDERELRRQLSQPRKGGSGRPAEAASPGEGFDDEYFPLAEEEPSGAFGPEDSFAPAGKAMVSRSVEKELLNFLARHPHNAQALKDAGLEMILGHPAAVSFWEKIFSAAPGFEQEAIFRSLTDREKAFWVRCRTVDAPSGGREREAEELKDICARIEAIYKEQETRSCLQALRQGGEVDGQALLKAIMEAKRAR